MRRTYVRKSEKALIFLGSYARMGAGGFQFSDKVILVKCQCLLSLLTGKLKRTGEKMGKYNIHPSRLMASVFFFAICKVFRLIQKIFWTFLYNVQRKNLYFSCIFILKSEKVLRRFAPHQFIYILFKFSVLNV